MTQEHPIKPPLELVDKWFDDAPQDIDDVGVSEYVATHAARWGADMELESCCKLLELSDPNAREFLYAARRPQPPSLKEQGLKALDSFEGFTGSLEEVDIIRRALESLPD